jgi:NTE family protein
MDVVLALGGGGIKGVAHIGVIDRLEEYGFRIRAIAGTSAGGLVGAAYATENTPHEILKAVQNIDRSTMYRRHSDDGPSFLGHAGLVEALASLLGDKTFSDCKIPFACTAVDINSFQEVYLHDGRLLDAASATMAVPGILPPMQLGKRLLVDGGVLDPVPVALARLLLPGYPVIAVSLSPAVRNWDQIPRLNFDQIPPLPIPLPSQLLQGFARMRLGQALRIFSQSIDISTRMMAELRLRLDKPDFVLRPHVSHHSMFEFSDPQELFVAGQKCVEDHFRELKRATSWLGHMDRFIRKIRSPNESEVLFRGRFLEKGPEEDLQS